MTPYPGEVYVDDATIADDELLFRMVTAANTKLEAVAEAVDELDEPSGGVGARGPGSSWRKKRDPVRSGVPLPRYVGCIRLTLTNRTAGNGNYTDAAAGMSTVFQMQMLPV